MSIRLGTRIQQSSLSPTYAVLDLAARLRASGRSIVDLGGGEPDFATPPHIIGAARAALDAGHTHYTPSAGKPELRRAIAAKLAHENGITARADNQIIVTPSAKHALFISLMTLIDPGDEIIILTPGWVSYRSMVELLGGKAIEVALDPATNFRVTEHDITAAVTPRTKAIIVNTPSNPTGRVLSQDELRDLNEIARRHQLVILSDEIYEHIVYDGLKHVSMASVDDAAERTITINGFSKAYAMTGWRLGYLAGPSGFVSEALKAQQHTVGCAASFVQDAAIEALTGPQQPVVEMTSRYRRRRDEFVAGLNRIPGVSCRAPEGAFYVLADIRRLARGNAVEVTNWLLEEAGVAVTPGSAFGATGEGYVRMSFAASESDLAESVQRIARCCERATSDGQHEQPPAYVR